MTQLKHFATLAVAFASFLSITTAQQAPEAKDRILVISGGGARGAWGGGLAKTLVTQFGHDYKVVIGASTGSLIAPFVALKEFKALEEGYTTISDKDIFNVCPYKTKGKNKGKVKGLQSFFRILTLRKTLGESKRLKKTIRHFYTEDLFNRFKTTDSTRQHVATVVNLTTDSVEYKSSKDFGYEEMVEWIWASANAPLFMSLHRTRDKNNRKVTYVDGGVKEGLPLQRGIEIACDSSIRHIDVIVHSTLNPRQDDVQTGGLVKVLGRVMELFLTETRQNDLSAARKYEVLQEDCAPSDDLITITYYFMPESVRKVMPNELLFQQKEMEKLWKMGEEHIRLKQTDPELSKLRVEIKIPREQLCNVGGLWNHPTTQREVNR